MMNDKERKEYLEALFKNDEILLGYQEALQFISEMPCQEDNCAACYAKKALEGGE